MHELKDKRVSGTYHVIKSTSVGEPASQSHRLYHLKAWLQQ